MNERCKMAVEALTSIDIAFIEAGLEDTLSEKETAKRLFMKIYQTLEDYKKHWDLEYQEVEENEHTITSNGLL